MNKKLWTMIVLAAILLATMCASAAAAGIDQEAAWQAALQDAGASAQTVTNQYCKLDTENGQEVYELSFVLEGAEYEYTLRAADGAIVEKEKEVLSSAAGNDGDTLITEDQASGIALQSAGKAASDVTFSKLKLERERGLWVYEITFRSTDGVEYEYEINASSGQILKESYDAWDRTAAQQPEAEKKENKKQSSGSSASSKKSSKSTGDSKATLSLSDAKSIVLKNAGVSGSKVKFSKAKLTRDDGRMIYDIEFYIKGKAEYEYEIDANTGKILDKDIEAWDDD